MIRGSESGMRSHESANLDMQTSSFTKKTLLSDTIGGANQGNPSRWLRLTIQELGLRGFILVHLFEPQPGENPAFLPSALPAKAPVDAGPRQLQEVLLPHSPGLAGAPRKLGLQVPALTGGDGAELPEVALRAPSVPFISSSPQVENGTINIISGVNCLSVCVCVSTWWDPGPPPPRKKKLKTKTIVLVMLRSFVSCTRVSQKKQNKTWDPQGKKGPRTMVSAGKFRETQRGSLPQAAPGMLPRGPAGRGGCRWPPCASPRRRARRGAGPDDGDI